MLCSRRLQSCVSRILSLLGLGIAQRTLIMEGLVLVITYFQVEFLYVFVFPPCHTHRLKSQMGSLSLLLVSNLSQER